MTPLFDDKRGESKCPSKNLFAKQALCIESPLGVAGKVTLCEHRIIEVIRSALNRV